MKLDGQIAVVTGSGSGIGKAIAHKFALEGCKIALVGRNKESLLSTIKEIQNRSNSVAITADITNPEQVADMAKQVIDEFGRIDILVNSAASGPAVYPTESLPLSDWKRVIDTDLTGTFLVCQSVGKEMIKKRYGRIINLASFHAIATYPQRAAYASAKAGVAGFTRALAIEWGGMGITVNAIAPGPIMTPRTSWFLKKDAESERLMLERTPVGRLGAVIDVAELAVFLSMRDTSYLTGQTIALDGGWTSSAWWGKYQHEK